MKVEGEKKNIRWKGKTYLEQNSVGRKKFTGKENNSNGRERVKKEGKEGIERMKETGREWKRKTRKGK